MLQHLREVPQKRFQIRKRIPKSTKNRPRKQKKTVPHRSYIEDAESQKNGTPLSVFNRFIWFAYSIFFHFSIKNGPQHRIPNLTPKRIDSGSDFARFFKHLGPSWPPLGPSWPPLGRSWAPKSEKKGAPRRYQKNVEKQGPRRIPGNPGKGRGGPFN